ncbi:DUF2130 domain-containing protein [Eubacterium sp.]
MNEIKCPKCGEVFTIDEASYASIVKQVRDEEFNAELKSREEAFRNEKESAIRLANVQNEKDLQEKISEKNSIITQLKSSLEQKENEKELAIAKAVAEKETELNKKEIELSELKSKIENSESQYALKERTLKEGFDTQLKLRDDEIERLKDFKAKQSTKMVGESLEQYCHDEFNKIRMTAFPNAYFEKDNDSRTGSKGDFIYRECDENGVELISIMFEMKNEMETTATKHKNENFFKELDKDRKEKKCEYAVLVSLLEADSDYYNAGIVDVSYQYEKMYVVRPQCFIPIITLLRNASLNSLKYKQELETVRNQNIDITNFENSLIDFKNDFSYNVEQAHKRFEEAIKGIDKTIESLTNIRKSLTKSDDQLKRANNKVDGVTIKKLTKGNPTMAAKFEELKNN